MEVFIKSDCSVFRKVEDEVVVVQLESGRFFYFNAETESLLSELIDPRRVDSTSLQSAPLKEVLDLLERERIVMRFESPVDAAELSSPEGSPALIRQGEIGVDSLPSALLAPSLPS